MTHWTISSKLFALAAIGGVGSIAVLGWLSVSHSTSALLEQQANALEAVRRSRQGYLENYFDIIREQLVNFAKDEMIVEATASFARAFAEIPLEGQQAVDAALERYYEGYLIGGDRLMRSDSRFDDRSTILIRSVNTESTRLALAGESGTLEQLDYREKEVLSSYGPLAIDGLRWAILAEVDMAEITAPAVTLRNRMVSIGAALIVVMGGLTLLLLRRVVITPIKRLARGASLVEQGEYSARVDLDSTDELGELARSFVTVCSRSEAESG